MRSARFRFWLRTAAVLLALFFAASEVLARGGRGGGGRGGGGFGGGGRSISRGGPAAGGFGSMQRSRSPSYSSSRYGAAQQPAYGRPSAPATRPSTPSTRPSTPSTRPSTPSTRPSTPSTRPGAPSASGPSAERPSQQPVRDRGQAGEGDRWDQRNENREDWQDHLNEAREDRQDYWENVDWDEVHVYDDDEFEWNSGTWIVLGVGTAITYTAWQSMSAQPACNLYQVEVEGTLYYRCGQTWYIEAVTAGEVRYVAVEPPPGY